MLHTLGRILWLGWNWIELILFTLFLYLLAWLPKRLTQSFYTRLFYSWCRSFVRALGVKLRLHEKNRKPLPKQFILVANHPSAFEDIGIPALFDVYPLAKMGVKKWFLFGKISEAAGTLFVKRDDKASRHAVVDQIIASLNEGKSVVIFPEGGCKGRRIFRRFNYGAFDISLRTGIPILPVFLHYEAQDTFEWRDPQTLIHKFWHFMHSRNNRANYYVFDALYPEHFESKEVFSGYVLHKFLDWQTRYLE